MPIVPNFKVGIGRLVTDRFDFQSHIDGTDFRHVAGSIDLSPSILIGSTVITDVQTAIAALAGSIIVPSVPDATTASKGVIQLSGDIAGTATNISVTQIKGTPLGTLTPALNDVLQWNGTNWVSAAIVPATSITLGTIKLGTVPADSDLAGIGSSANSPRVGALQGFGVSNASPSTGQALVWNGSVWTPTGIPTSPTGTGFATLTSGTYDAAATANIRYTAGKFQTDVNIQYKNSSITGDLSWLPTSTNKTLTLPDITDFLVARSSTDTLTNKTIVAANNTITDTSIAAGDILASNGTKFVRFAQGANGSFLGVSGGVLGYYTPASSTPTGTGFAHITGGVYDGTATANIRYAGGKLQTDSNIQFKNGGITGDLSWSPTASNKLLILPDTNDTVVGRATTDTLTNKTINASNNTVTDNATATGDLFKSNGSSFVRFPRGTSLQVLRTNTGATDLEWATVNLPPTEVRITQVGAGQLLDVASSDGSSNPAAVIRFSGDGAATDILVSGLVAPASPNSASTIRRITLVNVSPTSNRLILSNQDTNELTAINRFKFFGAANSQYVVGYDGYSIEIIWDSFDQRWRPITNLRALEYGVI